MRIRVAAIAFAVLAAGLIPTHAATPDQGTLTEQEPLVLWDGSVPGGEINPLLFVSPAPEVRCLTSECDAFQLTVQLGDGFWDSHPRGAVEVAIRWPYDGVIDLDLQVLDADGAVVGQSAAVDSNAENVFLSGLADGDYTVRVIPSNTFNPGNQSETVAYEGLVQLELPQTEAPGPLFPNLKALPPDGFHIASALNLIPFPENPLLSCYPEETLQEPGNPTRCLRFNQTIANVGRGPLVLRFALAGTLTPGDDDNLIVQRVSSGDGTFQDFTLAERYEFHEVHGHFHYKGFGQTMLFEYDPATEALGEPVSVGNKAGFCVIDVVLVDESWEKTGNGPRAHTFPFDCVVPDEVDPADPQIWLEQGVQVGWADLYGWNLADQYIDITGVPDGTYELVQIANPNALADPASSVLEGAGELDNNCASTIIQLSGDQVTTPLGPGTAIACPD